MVKSREHITHQSARACVSGPEFVRVQTAFFFHLQNAVEIVLLLFTLLFSYFLFFGLTNSRGVVVCLSWWNAVQFNRNFGAPDPSWLSVGFVRRFDSAECDKLHLRCTQKRQPQFE